MKKFLFVICDFTAYLLRGIKTVSVRYGCLWPAQCLASLLQERLSASEYETIIAINLRDDWLSVARRAALASGRELNRGECEFVKRRALDHGRWFLAETAAELMGDKLTADELRVLAYNCQSEGGLKSLAYRMRSSAAHL
jgi:hypothetical protein